MARLLVAMAVVALVGACSSTSDSEYGPPDGVACGATRCEVGKVCLMSGGSASCVEDGAAAAAPIGSATIKCDGQEDCAESGLRCISTSGERNVFECKDFCDAMGNEGVCASDADCRPCEKAYREGAIRCLPHLSLPNIKVCTSRAT
jgi:hypothetical protein